MILFIKYLIWIIVGLMFCFALFILYSTITEFRPPKGQAVYKSDHSHSLNDSIIYSVLSWNIGYGGLGANMDFFYDGGKSMRDTKDNILKNLSEMADFLEANDSIDFIFLQEVDFGAKRTYYIDEKKYFDNVLVQYQSYIGINYQVKFVPVPIKTPMGRVNSGIINYTIHEPENVTRFAYPGNFYWPKSLFVLKRCFLENRYNMTNGKQFILINTHNSAFDGGTLRSAEVNFLQEYAINEYKKGNYILIGGDWNQTPFGFKPQFSLPFDTTDAFYLPENFLNGWNVFSPENMPTNRQLKTSYEEGKTLTTVIDFFIASPNIEVLSNQVIDLKFKNADHQPILLTFKFRK